MTDPNCIFCQISTGSLETKKILANELVTCFYDANPSADTHVLVIPNDHIPSFLELTDDVLLGKMRSAAQELIQNLDLTSGYRLVFNGGRYQHIPHVHWHLLSGDISSIKPSKEF
jgi:histidine triad (HIT) family protein